MVKYLPDVCKIQYGFPFDSAQFSKNEGMPLIRIRDVVRGYSETFTTEPYKDEYIVHQGDLLIGMDGEFNIAKWGKTPALLNQRVCRLLPCPEIDKNYLFYFMPRALKQIEEKTPFVTVKHLSAKELNKIRIPLPPLDEQRRIAATLDKVTELIAKRRQQLDKLDELVKARFVEMFGDPQNNEKNWKMRTFKDICTVRQGLQIPISKRLTHFEENCYEYITVAYLHGVKEKEYIKNPKSTVVCTKDDILMTRTGNTGMVITNVAGVFHNNFFLIDFDRDKYIKEFLVEYLNLDLIQIELKKRAGTSTIPDLNHSEFYKIPIYEPSINLQNQFAIFVNQTEKAKSIIRRSLEKLETLKKALMQEYFG